MRIAYWFRPLLFWLHLWSLRKINIILLALKVLVNIARKPACNHRVLKYGQSPPTYTWPAWQTLAQNPLILISYPYPTVGHEKEFRIFIWCCRAIVILNKSYTLVKLAVNSWIGPKMITYWVLLIVKFVNMILVKFRHRHWSSMLGLPLKCHNAHVRCCFGLRYAHQYQ